MWLDAALPAALIAERRPAWPGSAARLLPVLLPCSVLGEPLRRRRWPRHNRIKHSHVLDSLPASMARTASAQAVAAQTNVHALADHRRRHTSPSADSDRPGREIVKTCGSRSFRDRCLLSNGLRVRELRRTAGPRGRTCNGTGTHVKPVRALEQVGGVGCPAGARRRSP
jgi:hypothetical protein